MSGASGIQASTAAFCDHVVVLSNGAVVATGSPAEVFTLDLLFAVYGVHAATLVNPLTGRLQLVYATRSDR